jgi:hypothetical protein
MGRPAKRWSTLKRVAFEPPMMMTIEQNGGPA